MIHMFNEFKITACSAETPKKSRYALSESEARVRRVHSRIKHMEKVAIWRLRAALDAAENKLVGNKQQLTDAIDTLDEGFRFVQSETKILADTLSHSVNRQDRICRRIRDLEKEVSNWESSFMDVEGDNF